MDGWGRDKFMERSVLLNPKNGFCINDTVIFRAEVTVYSTIATTTFNHMAMFGRGTTTIIDDLAEAWRQSVGVDSDDEDDASGYVVTNITSNNPSTTSIVSGISGTSNTSFNHYTSNASTNSDQAHTRNNPPLTSSHSHSHGYIYGYDNDQGLELPTLNTTNTNITATNIGSTTMKLNDSTDDSSEENEMKRGDEEVLQQSLHVDKKAQDDRQYHLDHPRSSFVYDPSSVFKDVTFKVGQDGVLIKASKFILCARSCVFKGMLCSGMLEAKTKFIVIDDIDETAFRHLLYFIYTDRVLDDLEEYAAQVLVAATKYQVTGLIERCSEALCARLTADNVHEVVELSSNFGAETLKEFCVAYVVENSKEVLQSGGIATLVPELRNELLEAIHNSEVYAHYNSSDNGYSKSKHGCCIL